ncbi:hypothetical protein DIURU_004527 [Diutina rugosa]|uniref:Peptidase A1 domain-containing protein n=1 Tax=Diutina rugosa TaxID=5481 RepID=A0A642UGS2_DIURU|nr:uncharacterized protein DIURU_004527 [Diutina rugosa]KAA8898683.1 hypothetical protein DIURU_004527 [Diutina rugosa]
MMLLSLIAVASALVVPAEPLDKRHPERIVTANVNITDQFYYHMQVKVGSQGHSFNPIPDTGSHESWLPDLDGWASQSTSLKNLTSPFTAGYVSSSYNGYWVTDTVTFTDGATNKFQFGVVGKEGGNFQNNFKEGMLGLSRWSGGDHDTFPYHLKNTGVIDRGVASLYYSTDKQKGKFIFGGYDQAKVASAWSTNSHPTTFKVPLRNVTTNGVTHYPDFGDFPIVVDTGAGYSWIPKAILDPIAQLYNNPKQSGTIWTVSCDIPDTSFQLGFGNLVLDIPLKDFVRPHKVGDTVCSLGAVASDRSKSNITLIGGAILNQVVTLFDYDNGVISVANYKETDEENIVKPE